MENYIIDEIIKVTKDEKSRRFFEKVVRSLGEERVAAVFSETKYQMHTRTVKNPAKYLTTLLMKELTTESQDNSAKEQQDNKRGLGSNWTENSLKELKGSLPKTPQDVLKASGGHV